MNKEQIGNQEEVLKDMYRSALKASYFRGIQNEEFLKRSVRPAEKEEHEDQNIDIQNMRVLKNFKRKLDREQSNIVVYEIYFQTSGFLCFSSKKVMHILEIYNSNLSIIRHHNLIYYVDFNVVSANVVFKGNRVRITFEDDPNNRSIQFAIQENFKSFKEKIENLIKNTKGSVHHHVYLAKTCPDFQRTHHVLNSQFESQANSGDIILFRCLHSAARAQRFITNSQYDHVALVLRNMKNELFMYESTFEEGVGLTPWKHMIKYEWYDQCQKVTWRPLHIELTPHIIEGIQNFIQKTLGKKYQISLNKLLVRTSTLERSKQDEQNKTYFCSQLVARLYKQLKLIDNEKSSATYYPVDFSEKGHIGFLQKDVHLGEERVIAFQKQKQKKK